MANTSTLTATGFLRAAMNIIRYNTPVKLSKVAPGEREITLEEVSWHDTYSDCWIVIYDRVYDVTDFLDEHPGGAEILLEYAGRDATVSFRGSGHSEQGIQALAQYMIGELPISERIFRKQGGYRLSDLPE